jgi:hypothetical protein
VADRDGGVGLQQHQRHRLAHGVAAPDHHRMLATQVTPVLSISFMQP